MGDLYDFIINPISRTSTLLVLIFYKVSHYGELCEVWHPMSDFDLRVYQAEVALKGWSYRFLLRVTDDGVAHPSYMLR